MSIIVLKSDESQWWYFISGSNSSKLLQRGKKPRTRVRWKQNFIRFYSKNSRKNGKITVILLFGKYYVDICGSKFIDTCKLVVSKHECVENILLHHHHSEKITHTNERKQLLQITTHVVYVCKRRYMMLQTQ